jgi:hypothetical protein
MAASRRAGAERSNGSVATGAASTTTIIVDDRQLGLTGH